MKEMKLDYARHGVTAVFATLASATVEQWLTAIENMEKSGYEGIHLEGRYLNVKKKGAHAEHLLSPLDANELDLILKHIHVPCHISAALELDADGSFSKKALEYGATLGLAHTCATAEEAKRALDELSKGHIDIDLNADLCYSIY
jgi:N-acetylglucosamine-6-phosphate deacetylase